VAPQTERAVGEETTPKQTRNESLPVESNAAKLQDSRSNFVDL